MGYSPTEYAEFTEPPAEMSSHGFHRFTQILRVRCSPTEFTEYTEFGSVGMAGMPYPPTSVLIRVICGSPFSARGSVYSVHSVGASSPLVLLVQFLLWQAAKPSGDSCTPWVGSVGMAGMPYPPTSVRIRAICGRLFSARGSVSSVLICGSFFTACSVGAAETAAPPGGIHGSSVHISPSHHNNTLSPRTLPSACPPSTVGTTSSPPAAR